MVTLVFHIVRFELLAQASSLPGTHRGGFINEDLRIGGPLLAAIPTWTMPVHPTTPQLSFLISQSRLIIQQTRIILNQFGVHNPDVDIYTRTSMLFPEPVSLATMLVLARRDTVDNRWLRAALEVHALLNM